jgi:integrase
MGSIRVRPDSNALYFDFRYRGQRCREQTTLSDTAANRARLTAVLRKIEKEIKADTFSYRSYFPASSKADLFESPRPQVTEPTVAEIRDAAVQAAATMSVTHAAVSVLVGTHPLFSEYVDEWYLGKEVEWMHSTQVKVSDILRKHLGPRFKGRRVGDISKQDILNLRTHLAKDSRDGKGLSSSRINGILNILRQILADAADRYKFTTPFQGIKPLRVKKTDVDPLSLTEVTKILGAVPVAHRPYYTVAILTAMRPSEQNALKWVNVDFERMQILVREALVYGETDIPKTPGSERDIAMSSLVADALRQQQALTAHLKSEYVFCQSNGQPINYRNMANRVWHPTLKALKIRRRKPYQTRHTAATLWLAAGESPEWIARQMGHTSTKMLFGTYSRFIPDATHKDGSAFERLLTQSGVMAALGALSAATEETQPDNAAVPAEHTMEELHHD